MHKNMASRFWLLPLALMLLLCVTAAPLISQEGGGDEKKVAKAEEDKEKEKKKKDLPLEPTRTIEFTTDEATWLSLDVSPDGNTIVFELLGDLYPLPIAGGEATRITSGMGFDSQPRYSPDGTQLVFLSDRGGSENVWIAADDGTDPKQLSKDSGKVEFASPMWSSNGTYIIASRTM